ncbi:hypothetical protein MSAN_00887500 [Mycena sanguinolenta]|uniref:Vacuolar protein sorting-associated protein 26 n=1 Tax=Mycena sanguinolenta TaxID=230812 RepID=A0A8H7DBT5_9AGAR|nr:hypothetical protein MSAN_00887500 [Mycena sanguinolenta]
MAAYFFASPIDVDIKLVDEEQRKQVDIKSDKDKTVSCPVYYDGESVTGTVAIRVRDGKKLQHDGIKVEFVGSIGEFVGFLFPFQCTECCMCNGTMFLVPDCLHFGGTLSDESPELFYDRGHHHEFLSLSQELAAPGEMRSAQTFDFNFKNVEKQFESYQGINVKLRYFVRVSISRRLADAGKERDIWVHSFRPPPETNATIKMEVGIEDCLHIEFEYNKSKCVFFHLCCFGLHHSATYPLILSRPLLSPFFFTDACPVEQHADVANRYHLKDVIVGKIYFLLVRIKIKHMELSIIRRETTGSPPNQYNESETITKFEIMDGAPVRGETIPIRLFLGGFDLTPTFRDINKKFSTRYYLNLVLIDEENRRYFKQQEITIVRIPEN